jgi:type IV pilus assembly protein PilY1
LLHTFNTGVGSAAAPAGLAHIEGLIPDETDFTVTELYAGDLQGNVWRFDVKTTTAWATTATKFAELKDASGNAQPITTVTRPSIDPVTATRYVFVGTGKLLDVSDVPCSTNPPPPGITCLPIPNVRPQSLYAIKDGSLYAPATTGLPRLRSALSNVARSSITGGANQALQGWVIDLPPGEVMVTEPIPNVGIVTFATSTPSTNPCDPGAFGTAYARVYGSGDSKVKTLGMPVPFFGGVAGSAGIAGIRFVRTRSTTGIGGNVVGTITTTTGNIASIDIDFARQFVGVGVNYREILN